MLLSLLVLIKDRHLAYKVGFSMVIILNGIISTDTETMIYSHTSFALLHIYFCYKNK